MAVLYQAIMHQSLEMTTQLLQHGAKYDFKDFSDRTTLSWAADDPSLAIKGPANRIAKMLIERGADIHSSDYKGRKKTLVRCSGWFLGRSCSTNHAGRFSRLQGYGRTYTSVSRCREPK